jgi:hypothetical protein
MCRWQLPQAGDATPTREVMKLRQTIARLKMRLASLQTEAEVRDHRLPRLPACASRPPPARRREAAAEARTPLQSPLAGLAQPRGAGAARAGGERGPAAAAEPGARAGQGRPRPDGRHAQGAGGQAGPREGGADPGAGPPGGQRAGAAHRQLQAAGRGAAARLALRLVGWCAGCGGAACLRRLPAAARAGGA